MATVTPLGMDRPARIAVAVGLCLAPALGLGVVHSGKWIVAGIAITLLALTLLRQPLVGVYALIVGTFFDTITITTPFATLGAGDVSALALNGAWLGHRLVNPRPLQFPERSGLLLGYFVLAFTSLTFGVAPQTGIGVYARLLTYGLTMVAVVDLVRDIKTVERLTIVMALCGLVHAALGLGFMSSPGRLAGLVGQPNLLGALIALGVFPTAAWLIRSKNQVVRMLLAGAFLFMALAIVFTISRGTYIAAGLAFIWWIRRSARLAIAVTVILGATYFTMVHFAQDRVDRIEHRLRFQDSSVVNRGIVAKNGFLAIAEAPILGVGFGQFGHASDAVNITSEVGRGTHNFYLGIAASTGLPALLLFLWFLSAQARRIGRGLKLAREKAGGVFGPDWARYEWGMALFQTLMLYHSASLMVRGGRRLEWTFFSLYAAMAAISAAAERRRSAQGQSSEQLPAE